MSASRFPLLGFFVITLSIVAGPASAYSVRTFLPAGSSSVSSSSSSSSSRALLTEADFRALCMERLKYGEADLAFGSNLYRLRECITTERKKQDSEVLAKEIRAREQKQRDEVINPTGTQLRQDQQNYHAKTVGKQNDIKISQSAQIRQNWLKREQEFLKIRASSRVFTQTTENAAKKLEQDVQKWKMEAQRLCRHLRGTERLACIEARVKELKDAQL